MLLGLVTFSALSSGRDSAAQTASPSSSGAKPACACAAARTDARLAPVADRRRRRLAAGAATRSRPPQTHWRAPAMIVDLSEAQPPRRSQPGAPQRRQRAAPPTTSCRRRRALRRCASAPTVSTPPAPRGCGHGQRRRRRAPSSRRCWKPRSIPTCPASCAPWSAATCAASTAPQVLIPRGSKLIGQYRSGVAHRPDARLRRLVAHPHPRRRLHRRRLAGHRPRWAAAASPARPTRHFLERFGAAILLSVITAGLDALSQTATAAPPSSSARRPRPTRSPAIALQKQIDIPPTIKVPQGTPLQVFVARDLDFSGAVEPR